MRKTSLFFAFAATLCICSCSKEKVENHTPQQEEQLVPVTLAVSSNETKTFIDGTTIKWQAEDKIAVYDKLDEAREFEINEESIGGKSASFKGEVAAGTTEVYAVYPYTSAAGISSGKISVTLPTVQNIAAGNVAQGALVAIGKGTLDGIALHNVFAYIKVTVTKEDITSIVINGTNIAGTALVNPETGIADSVTGGENTVTVTYGENDVFPKGDYYIALLPGTTAAGEFSVTMTRESELSAMKTASKAVVLARNNGLDMADLDATLEWVFNIYNKTSLRTFLTNAAKYENGNKAIVTADINCDGETLTGASSFKGILDGNNKTISNFKIQANKDRVGVFEIIDGNAVIKDITFGAEGDGSTIILNRTSQSGGYNYVAPVAYVSGAASLENVTNYCDIEVSSTTISQSRAGGIAGMWNSTSTEGIKNCKNYGNVTNNATAQTATAVNALGGIVAQADKVLNITKCENHGDVTNHSKYTTQIGGILGRSGQVNIYTSCKNYGKLSNDAVIDGTNALIMGGIAGSVNASISNTQLTGCENRGEIENTGKATSLYMAGIASHIAGHVFNNCANYGDIHNNSASATVYIGGIAAFGQSAKPSFTDCTNTGSILNESPSAITTVNIGGIFGRAHQQAKFAGCVNGEAGSDTKGSITNTAPVSNGNPSLCLGGIYGFDQAASSVENQINYGPIKNSGNAEYPCIAGVVGYTNQAITVKGCENHGNVTLDNCTTTNPFFGGVAGELVNAGIKVTSSKNYGNVTISNTVMGAPRIGGVIGYSTLTAAITSCENHGNVDVINSSKCSGMMCLGGIAGQINNASFDVIQSCSNNGAVTVNIAEARQIFVGGIVGQTYKPGSGIKNYSGNVNKGAISITIGKALDGGFYYLGGIAGNNLQSIRFDGCTNKGDLTYSGAAKMRIGGITPYTDQPLNGATVNCNITVTSTGLDYSEVGGIVGYTANANLTGWNFEGTINTSASTKKVYTGGLLGKTNGSSKFNDCKFKGTLTGAAGNNMPGLYVGGLQATGYTITLGGTTACKVGTGSVVNGSAITTLTAENLVSQSSDGGTFTANVTMTNISIAD